MIFDCVMERVRDIEETRHARWREFSMDPLAHLSAELQNYEFSSDSEGNHAKKVLGKGWHINFWSPTYLSTQPFWTVPSLTMKGNFANEYHP